MRFGLREDGILLMLMMSSVLISYLGYSIYRDMQSPSTFFNAPQEAVVIPEAHADSVNLEANNPPFGTVEALAIITPADDEPPSYTPGLRKRD